MEANGWAVAEKNVSGLSQNLKQEIVKVWKEADIGLFFIM